MSLAEIHSGDWASRLPRIFRELMMVTRRGRNTMRTRMRETAYFPARDIFLRAMLIPPSQTVGYEALGYSATVGPRCTGMLYENVNIDRTDIK